MMNRSHRLGGHKITILIPQTMNMQHIYPALQKSFNPLLNMGENFHPTDDIMFGNFQVSANEWHSTVHR